MTIRICFIILTFFTVPAVQGQCSLNYTSVNPICNGVCNGQVQLFPTGTSPYSYTWSNGDSTETVDSLCAGTYTINMMDDLGCSTSAIVTITEPLAPFTVDTYLVSNSSVSGPCEGQIGWTTSGGQPDYTVSWYDCNTMNLYTSLPYFCPGEYFSVFIDDYGCVDTSDCVVVNNNVVGISEVLTNDVFVYPNPTQNVFTVSGIDKGEIYIYSLEGKLLLTQIVDAQNQINVSSFPKGFYFLKVVSGNDFDVVKIVKE